MKVLDAGDVARLLPMADAIECVETAMIAVSQGKANLPLRMAMDIDGTNRLGLMPGAMSDPKVYGVKVLSLFPGNPARGLSSHIGMVILFDNDTGAPVVSMNADAITAIRTAAASAAATRALARADANILGLIGTGEQAESHLGAITRVRDVTHVQVAGRTPERAEAFVERMTPGHPDLTFQTCDTAKAAARGADILCTLTSSSTVVLRNDWVEPGCHVNAVGASMSMMQEVDEALVATSDLFVDYRPSALAQARDIINAIESGLMSEAEIRAEIGEVFAGTATGRSRDDAVTVYRSLGVAAQDLACADLVWKRFLAEV